MTTKYRKKPVEVDAVQWTGDNEDEVFDLTGCAVFGAITAATRTATADPAFTAEVYDGLHDTWIPLRTGDWVVRGTRGEFWPVRGDIFAETYEPAEAQVTA